MNILQSFSLDGKVALLTGGAGGYGLQCSRALAEAGAKTYMASRNVENLKKTAEKLNQNGGHVSVLPFDQGNEKSILALRDQVVEREGRIDVLVNNAVARTVKKGWEADAANFDESMRVNATGLFLLTRAVGEVMIPQKSGSIINIGSMMGMVGVENHNYEGTDMSGWAADYFFHKGGMINFTRHCGSYFGRYGIRVNCVSPGGLYSENLPERFIANYSQRTQLGRLANETDLMGCIVFLAADASLYITGVNIPLDGGYTAK